MRMLKASSILNLENDLVTTTYIHEYIMLRCIKPGFNNSKNWRSCITLTEMWTINLGWIPNSARLRWWSGQSNKAKSYQTQQLCRSHLFTGLSGWGPSNRRLQYQIVNTSHSLSLFRRSHNVYSWFSTFQHTWNIKYGSYYMDQWS